MDLIFAPQLEKTQEQWDNFVMAHAKSSLFHRYGWTAAMAKTYGYKPYFLMSKQGETVSGICPLLFVTSPLFGKSLISAGFSIGGGALANDTESYLALCEKAASLGESLGVNYVELRDMPYTDDNTHDENNWIVKNNTYAGFEKEIASDVAENLLQIPRKKRADLRKGIKAVEEGRLSINENANIDDFYPLYAESVRNLGTPVYPKKLLQNLQRYFKDDMQIITIGAHTDDINENIAGLVSFFHKGKVLPYYGGAKFVARKLHAYDFMYWAQMRSAVKRGANIYDFGRSKFNTGAFDYKTYWGFEGKALAYQYYLVNAKEMPDVNPNNPKFKMLTEIWQKLPMPIANLAGPVLARNLA